MGLPATCCGGISQRPDQAKVSRWQGNGKTAMLFVSVGFEEILRGLQEIRYSNSQTCRTKVLGGQSSPFCETDTNAVYPVQAGHGEAHFWFSECIMSFISSVAIVLSLLISLSCP